MSAGRCCVMLLVLAGVALPIVIGASCPPPSNPPFFDVTTDTNVADTTVLPSCLDDNSVCVTFANKTTLPVAVSLYYHNGFDPTGKCGDLPAFSCCANPNSTVACPCICTGADAGECMINRDELFGGCLGDPPTAHLRTISGLTVLTLAPTSSSPIVRIDCGDVKTLGAAAAFATGDPVAAPEDRDGPVYRDEPGGVPCGESVQFEVINLNETGAGTGDAQEDLASIIIQPRFSR